MRPTRTSLVPALLVLLAAPVPASPDPPVPPPPAPHGGVQQRSSKAGRELAKLVAEFDEAQKAYSDAVRSASTPEDRRAAGELRPSPDDYVPRFLALARRHPRTDPAFEALAWVTSRSRSNESKAEAIALLAADHSNNAELAGLCMGWVRMRDSATSDALRRLSTGSTVDEVRAVATYSLGVQLKYRARFEPENDAGLRQEAEELLDRVAREFGDVKTRRGELGELVEGPLFELRHLQIGMVVPDIEGEDIDGVPFKLSDYRGKVVVIDFWGHW